MFSEGLYIKEEIYKLFLLFFFPISYIIIALERPREGKYRTGIFRLKMGRCKCFASQCFHSVGMRNLKCLAFNFDLILDIDVLKEAMKESVAIG